MTHEKINTELEKLNNGLFENIDLDNWFSIYFFDYVNDNYYNLIDATLNGLDKNINIILLNFIAIYANHFLMKFEQNKLDFKDQKKYLEILKIIEKVIKISSNHHEYYSIINNFYNHSNFLVRLFCAANGNYTPYLYDKEERVRKIGYIISEFLNFYRHLSDSEREIIDFLKNALDVKAILVTEEKDCYAEFIDASFKSILFNGIITIQNFDADILYRLKDKRILAYKIYKYIKENEIEINFDMFPQEFGKEKTRKLTQMKK